MKITLEEPNYEGVRINFKAVEEGGIDGWCLLRKSLHDPILPMNIASDQKGGSDKIKRVMSKFLSQYAGLDLSVM